MHILSSFPAENACISDSVRFIRTQFLWLKKETLTKLDESSSSEAEQTNKPLREPIYLLLNEANPKLIQSKSKAKPDGRVSPNIKQTSYEFLLWSLLLTCYEYERIYAFT